MHFTIFTFVCTIFWVSAFAVIAKLIRKHVFNKFISIYPLLFFLSLCILRLFLSFELPYTVVINSDQIMPFLQKLLCQPLITINFIEINLYVLILFVWISVAVTIFIRQYKYYKQFRHLLDFMPEFYDPRIQDIFTKADIKPNKIKVIVHKAIEAPAIVGLIKPVILIPTTPYTDEELYLIFLHEIMHYRLRHCLFKYFAEIVRIVFWWNPLFKGLSSEVAHVLELQTDKAVCAKVTPTQKRTYLTVIIKSIKNAQYSSSLPYLCSLIEEKNDNKIQQRFQVIMKDYSKKRYDLIIIPLTIFFFFLSYVFLPQPYSEPSVDMMGTSEQVSPGSYLIQTENGYELYDENEFIAEIEYIDESLKNLEVYTSKEERK